MQNFFNEIINELSEDEKLILEKIQNKLFDSFEKQKQESIEKLESTQDPYIDFSKEHPNIIRSKNLTGNPNELVFTIRAEASQIGEKGQLLSIVDIVEKFYHIPIEAHDNYTAHMDKFFENFHNTLEEACKVIAIKKNEK